MFTMKKKIISGTLVALMALGLAGCANNNAAPASKVSSHPQTTKVAKKAPANKKSATSSSTKAAQSSQSSASVTANSTSQAQANTQASYAATNDNSGQVVNQFVKASGIKENQANQYMVSQPDSQGNYQVEIRDSQGDPNVSHLDGIYHFNPATNQVEQMDPVTGQFEAK